MPSSPGRSWVRKLRSVLSVLGLLLAGAIEVALWLQDYPREDALLLAVKGAWLFALTAPGSVNKPSRSPAALTMLAGCLAAVAGGWMLVAPNQSLSPALPVSLAFVAAVVLVATGGLTWLAAQSRRALLDGQGPGSPGAPGLPAERESGPDYTELWVRTAGCLFGFFLFVLGWVLAVTTAAGYGVVIAGVVSVIVSLFYRRF